LVPADCKKLEEGIIVEPKSRCEFAMFAENWPGCTCTIGLPRTVNPIPDTLADPFTPAMEPDATIPTFPPLRELPPPVVPNQPYVPPMMNPECPYTAKCVDPSDFHCIDFSTWGFTEVQMAAPSPASMYFNAISCNYAMANTSSFRVPEKVKALAKVKQQRDSLSASYKERLDVKCDGPPLGKTVGDFCRNTAHGRTHPCDMTWEKLLGPNCRRANPPTNFESSSLIRDICPLECQA
jgi:hypothetical protein